MEIAAKIFVFVFLLKSLVLDVHARTPNRVDAEAPLVPSTCGYNKRIQKSTCGKAGRGEHRAKRDQAISVDQLKPSTLSDRWAHTSPSVPRAVLEKASSVNSWTPQPQPRRHQYFCNKVRH